jgi:DNA adenine methylase
MINQPFKTYNGGKSGSGVYQAIINFIPKCDVFIDAMVGNAGIVSKIKFSTCSIVINDIDTRVINSFHADKNNCVSSGNLPAPIVKNNCTAGNKENLHVEDLIDKYDCARSCTFFYFDPPYLKTTRLNSKNLYRYDWTEKDHFNFLSKVITMKSNCMISHYPCKLYNDFLKGWNTHLFQGRSRAGKTVECIYMNYEKPKILQDYQYIGSNFIERQRIKRKTLRWCNRLEALPEDERTAILSSIIAKYNYTSGELLKG